MHNRQMDKNIEPLDSALLSRLSRFLSYDEIEAISGETPSPRAVRGAIQTLDSLYHTLSSYIPSYLGENVEALRERGGKFWKGTFFFSDVSGFTALYEKLSAYGPEGIEKLTDAMNEYFADMLDILSKSGGILMKFAGDALLVFFPAEDRSEKKDPLALLMGDEDKTEGEDVAWAIRTGIRMQRAMSKFQPFYTQMGSLRLENTLTMSVGISRGELVTANVGTPIRRDYMILGEVPSVAMEAEGVGEPGEVIVSAEAYEFVADEFRADSREDGAFMCICDDLGDALDDFEFRQPTRRRASSLAFNLDTAKLGVDLESVLERVEVVSTFLAPDLLSRVVARSSERSIRSEHRPATVVFAHFTGAMELLEAWGDDELPRVLDILDRYYIAMQRAVARCGGSLTRNDPYKMGCKLLITFGAPVAHSDDPERAAAAALEMHEQLALLNRRWRDECPPHLLRKMPADFFIQHRIGINHGMVFAGEVGWRARREYTVMGDDVNLSARLMSKAEMGTTLVNVNLWERVKYRYDGETLPPISVKGKSQPIDVYTITAEKSGDERKFDSLLPFVGRRAQLQFFREQVDELANGQGGGVVAVRGEMGMGKTRLLKEILPHAQSLDVMVLQTTCREHTDSYRPWIEILLQCLSLGDLSGAEKRERVEESLEMMGLSEFFPVMADLLELPPAESDGAAPAPRKKSSGGSLWASLTSKEEKGEGDRPKESGGIFGAMRSRLSDRDKGKGGGSLWQRVRQRTDVPGTVVNILSHLSQSKPIVLVIDDFHHAGRDSVKVMQHMLSSLGGLPILLVAAYQAELMKYNMAEGDAESAEAKKIALGPLPQDETLLLACELLDANALDDDLAQMIYERTAGQPLFVEMMAAMLKEGDYIRTDSETGEAHLASELGEDEVPVTIRQMVLSRIDRLEPAARDVLLSASVLGDSFPVQALSAIHENLRSREVETLTAAGILQQEGEICRFSHSLARTVAYDSLPKSHLRALHEDAGDFWRGSDGDAPSSEQLANMIYHYTRSDNLQMAVSALKLARSRAEEEGHIEQAVAYNDRILDLMYGLPDFRSDHEEAQIMAEKLSQKRE